MNMLTLILFIWKLLGKLVLLDLCIQTSTLHTLPFTRCPSDCICTADLLYCAKKNLTEVPGILIPTATTLDLSYNAITKLNDRWLAALPRLQILRISHNEIHDITQKVFQSATCLVHLDMSSNYLNKVEKYYFEGLVNLEELLLYNNQIVKVDEDAFLKLTSLQKVYLSWNKLTEFPFEFIQRLEHSNLRTLDLSVNNLNSIPVKTIAALPGYIQNGLYLHHNPMKCDCTLHQMLQEWKHRGFSSAQDFIEEHTCKVYSNIPRSLVNTFKYNRYFGDCSWNHTQLDIPKLNYKVGDTFVIDCNTTLHCDNSTRYKWFSPRHELFEFSKHSDSEYHIFKNGSLKITNANVSDSGVYLCTAIGGLQKIPEIHEINVTIQYPKLTESFKPGYTTLLGCIVSLVLVVVYLYLTPCRCTKCCRKPTSAPQDCSGQSSILSTTPPATEGPSRKISANKHVVFLEPIMETQNGKVKLAVSEDFPDAKSPKLLQLKLDTESIRSVFSDPPHCI